MFDATIITPLTKDPELFDLTDVVLLEWDFEKTLSKQIFNKWADMLDLNVRTAVPEILHKIGISPEEKIVISDFFWYAMKQEKAVELFEGKDIIIVCPESKPNGYQYMDQYWGHTQKGTLDENYLSNFNNVSYIIDNAHPDINALPNVDFVPSHDWGWNWLRSVHPESQCSKKHLLRKSDQHGEHNWQMHWKKMDVFFNNWNTTPKDYTLSLGTMKTFRLDLYNKLKDANLLDSGFVGTYSDTWNKVRLLDHKDHFDKVLTKKVDLDAFPEKIPQLPGDRKPGYDAGGAGGYTYNEQCHFCSKVELVVESVAEPSEKFIKFGKEEHNGIPFPISQMTEKTGRAIVLGKPFLLVTTNVLYDQLEEWGFDWYKSVFGDYRGKDFEETNNNICDILRDLRNKRYDTNMLQRIAMSNYNNVKDYAQNDFDPQKIAKKLNFD